MKHKLGLIVPSWNTVMWKMLRVVGDTRAVPGAGRLFWKA